MCGTSEEQGCWERDFPVKACVCVCGPAWTLSVGRAEGAGDSGGLQGGRCEESQVTTPELEGLQVWRLEDG